MGEGGKGKGNGKRGKVSKGRKDCCDAWVRIHTRGYERYAIFIGYTIHNEGGRGRGRPVQINTLGKRREWKGNGRVDKGEGQFR